MGRKKVAQEAEHPDYEQLKTIDEVDAEIKKYKDSLVSRDLLERRMKAERKEFAQAINEQLREVGEEREHLMGVIGALHDRRRQIDAPTPSSNVIPWKGAGN